MLDVPLIVSSLREWLPLTLMMIGGFALLIYFGLQKPYEPMATKRVRNAASEKIKDLPFRLEAKPLIRTVIPMAVLLVVASILFHQMLNYLYGTSFYVPAAIGMGLFYLSCFLSFIWQLFFLPRKRLEITEAGILLHQSVFVRWEDIGNISLRVSCLGGLAPSYFGVKLKRPKIQARGLFAKIADCDYLARIDGTLSKGGLVLVVAQQALGKFQISLPKKR